MKFGKWLKKQIEESLPDWRDQYLCYKELKHHVNAISAGRPLSAAEAEFVELLNAEIDKLNNFFIEQEEEFIIQHRELQEEIKRVVEAKAAMREAEYAAVIAGIRKVIVNFHGEMVLLLNYSSINYIGLAKILKKYDKRTGGVLRLPVIENVLQQPFFETETVSEMVKKCEAMMEALFPAAAEQGARAAAARREREALAVAGWSIFRNTVAALLTMQDVRNGSSTYGRYSLPPLSLPDSDWLRSFQVQLTSPPIPTL